MISPIIAGNRNDEMDTRRKAHLTHSPNVVVFVFAFFLR